MKLVKLADEIKKINSLIKLSDYHVALKVIKELPYEYSKLKFISSQRKYCEFLISRAENSVSCSQDVIDCVCLNATVKEVAKIDQLFDIWNLSSHSDGNTKACRVDLIIALDIYDESVIDQIKLKIKDYRVDFLFKKIDIVAIDIPSEINFYKRTVDGSVDLDVCTYGYKSGPNYQFFSIMKLMMKLKYRFVFLCETDTFPMRADWVDFLFDEANKNSPFWVLGSPFLGRSKIDPSLALHINGAAIYAVSELGFSNFLDRWESILLGLVKEVPYIAYDWAIDYYYYNYISPKNWEILTHEDFHNQIEFRRMCRFSGGIVNLAGEAERSGVGRYSLDEVRSNHPSVAIVHGDYFYDEFKTGLYFF